MYHQKLLTMWIFILNKRWSSFSKMFWWILCKFGDNMSYSGNFVNSFEICAFPEVRNEVFNNNLQSTWTYMAKEKIKSCPLFQGLWSSTSSPSSLWPPLNPTWSWSCWMTWAGGTQAIKTSLTTSLPTWTGRIYIIHFLLFCSLKKKQIRILCLNKEYRSCLSNIG